MITGFGIMEVADPLTDEAMGALTDKDEKARAKEYRDALYSGKRSKFVAVPIGSDERPVNTFRMGPLTIVLELDPENLETVQAEAKAAQAEADRLSAEWRTAHVGADTRTTGRRFVGRVSVPAAPAGA